MAADSPGQGLSRRFYWQEVSPLPGDIPHAAALLGDGSEVLGYDDEVSTDHDFGPRLQVFLTQEADEDRVHAALPRLPQKFEDMSVAFSRAYPYDNWPGHQVEVTTVERYFTSVLGVDPANGMELADWLLIPSQHFASVTAGPVFHDPDKKLAQRRAALAWYPDDIWRYALAAEWLRIGQEQAFIGRTGGTGDDLGSALVAARLARDIVRLAFLVERRWAPYSKWLGRAFRELALSRDLGPALHTALTTTDWREREGAICAAASTLGAATNRLDLAAPVSPTPHRFYTRDIMVVSAERFAESLTDAITDAEVQSLLERLDTRRGSTIPSLPGTIDQAVDSTEILTRIDCCRAAATIVGLPA